MTNRPARPALGAFLVLALAASTASTQTVDDVVRRYLQARGGIEKLHSVRSLRLTGTMEIPGVAEAAPFVMELARPHLMRTEFTVEGRQAIRAFDGRDGWAQLPLPGEPPRPMAAEDAAEAADQADVDLSPLVDAGAKGFAIELVGKDRIPGGETWQLTVKGGLGRRTVHIDTKTHLVIATEETRTVEGQPVEFVTNVGDYRSVQGLQFPFRIEVGPKGSVERQRLVLTKVEVNPPLDASRFSMPR
jgi:hypothetical protein